MRTAVLLLAALVLNGCAGLNFVYMRADGQDMTANPALYQQFETDRVVCQSENIGDKFSPTGMGGFSGSVRGNGAAQDCMEKKGYMVLSADAAAAKQKEFDAAAAEKARLEAEAAAPPPPPRVAAKHKPKPKPPASALQWPPPPQPMTPQASAAQSANSPNR